MYGIHWDGGDNDCECGSCYKKRLEVTVDGDKFGATSARRLIGEFKGNMFPGVTLSSIRRSCERGECK